MKAALYYFTSTGNTLTIARDIAREIGGADIVPMAKAVKSGEGPQHDVIGIIFPVYMFGLPLVVAEFVRKMTAPEGAYVFAVANFGKLQGRSLSLLEKMLHKRGIKLSSGFGIRMPGNYTPLYEAIPEEDQRKMFADEKAKVKEIAKAVLSREEGTIDESPFLPNFLLYMLLYRLGASQVRGEGKRFWITDACTKCGLCAKVCPVSNITMLEGSPVWLDHCEQCMGCLQWCPTSAIQFGKSTKGRRRYHHPDVNAPDIAAQKA